jgi:hypothetical protein
MDIHKNAGLTPRSRAELQIEGTQHGGMIAKPIAENIE